MRSSEDGGVDRSVVERAARGDRDAFALLTARSIDRMYRIAERILRDPEAARDATQQALVEAWRGLPSLRDPDRWEAWTYRLLVRAAYREAGRGQPFVGRVRLLANDAIVTDAAGAIADRDELERAFRSLSPEHRAVVVLHHYEGLPLTEVAAALGIPAGTARSRLHNALRTLRAALEAERRTPSDRKDRAG
jgi:RNA polymerase sigma-70 factor (ECF subfamily)